MVKSGRVQNMGGVTYNEVYERGRLHINVPKKGKEEKEGERERGRVILLRWTTLWFALWTGSQERSGYHRKGGRREGGKGIRVVDGR